MIVCSMGQRLRVEGNLLTCRRGLDASLGFESDRPENLGFCL